MGGPQTDGADRAAMTQKLLPVTGDARYCAVIKLTEDLVKAVESGKANSGLSIQIGKGKHMLKLGDKEFPLFVTAQKESVAYQCVDGVLQEVGAIEQSVRVKPHAGAGGKKRREKDPAAKKKKETTEPSIKRKSEDSKRSVSKKPRSSPSLKGAVPKSTSEKAISAINKQQRVMHVLAINPIAISQLKAHPLLKRLGKEELSRIARSVADLGQGGKFTLKKGEYRKLDPDYALLEGEELEMIKTNIVLKGQLDLSQCVPLREESSPPAPSPGLAPKIDKAKAATKEGARPKKVELTSAQEKARGAAASILSKNKDTTGSLTSVLGMSVSRQSELKELEGELHRRKAISSVAEAEQMKLKSRDLYPEYQKLNSNLDNIGDEFRKLKQELNNSQKLPQKRSLENQINSLYATRLDQVQKELHRYNYLHTELHYMKEQLKLWESKQLNQ